MSKLHAACLLMWTQSVFSGELPGRPINWWWAFDCDFSVMACGNLFAPLSDKSPSFTSPTWLLLATCSCIIQAASCSGLWCETTEHITRRPQGYQPPILGGGRAAPLRTTLGRRPLSCSRRLPWAAHRPRAPSPPFVSTPPPIGHKTSSQTCPNELPPRPNPPKHTPFLFF